MKTLNYNLSSGNKTLVQEQAQRQDMFAQFWYQNIVATDVKIEVWVSGDKAKTFSKVIGAEKTLIPADNTVYFSLSGLAFAYVEFRLVVGSAVAGTITGYELQK